MSDYLAGKDMAQILMSLANLQQRLQAVENLAKGNAEAIKALKPAPNGADEAAERDRATAEALAQGAAEIDQGTA